jgi:predicted nucleic acid-binding protein
MIFDTDVLIWVFRGNPRSAALVEETEERFLSVVSYMELLQGAQDKAEVRAIEAFLADAGFQMTPLSENIGHRASIYMEEFGLKAGMKLGDALLEATAVENHLTLCTANRRHYRPISELELMIFQP